MEEDSDEDEYDLEDDDDADDLLAEDDDDEDDDEEVDLESIMKAQMKKTPNNGAQPPAKRQNTGPPQPQKTNGKQ